MFDQIISICLFPLTIIYCIVVAYKRIKAKPIDFGVKIVSIGNIVLGGSGKTPLTIELAKNKDNVAVILRGYGRNSKGMYVVSDCGKILENVDISGDEAQLLALSLPKATVIVSQNRAEAIIKAKQLGAKLIFLDDGHSQYHIQKIDILIRPKTEPTNLFCLPSGGYRETKMNYAFADVVLQDGVDFVRKTSFSQNGNKLDNLPEKLLLVTAISKANRLFEYLPDNIHNEIFPDHYNFTQNDINNIISKYPDYTVVTTAKDMVKLKQFNLKNIITIDLEIDIINKSKIANLI